MLRLSQKGRYALAAMLELARQGGPQPTKISHIAAAGRMPWRFLEAILVQLKQGGFVESRRGAEGGYLLARAPEAITIGQVVRFIEARAGAGDEALPADSPALAALWRRACEAVDAVLDSVTLADVVEADAAVNATPNYSI